MFAAVPPIFEKSRFRFSNRRLQQHSRIFLLLPLLLLFLSFQASSSATQIPYHLHCNSTVPESASTPSRVDTLLGFLNLRDGYFSGGGKLFAQNPQSFLSLAKSVDFRLQSAYKTQTDGILRVQATLNLRGGKFYPSFGTSTVSGGIGGVGRFRRIRPRLPKVFHQRGKVSFELRGFWLESAGKLCMVGAGSGYSREGNLLDLSAVFKLNYPKVSNISTSLVAGSVESLDAPSGGNYFDPISVVGFSQSAYEYTMVAQAENSCLGSDDGEKSLSLEAGSDACSVLSGSANGRFRLDYGGDCVAGNCNPFNGIGGFLPRFMTVGGIQCSDNGRLHFYLGFSNASYYSSNAAFDPERILIGEGIWNKEKKRLCAVGCRLLNFADSLAMTSVEDCTIRLMFRFPSVLSVRVRSATVGRIWSTRNENESGYFERIALRSLRNRMKVVPGLKYEYTRLGLVNKSCRKKSAKGKGKRYPDGYSFQDMRFDMTVKDDKGNLAWGYASPLTVGNDLFVHSYSTLVSSNKSKGAMPFLNHTLLNVSYLVVFKLSGDNNWGGISLAEPSSGVSVQIDISAEGVYDSQTGNLCMVGCRFLGWSGKRSSGDGMDCEIFINVEFSPLNAKEGENLKGTIGSTREKSDPLYFKPLEMFSSVLYTKQAKESIWRMDLEIVMVLISLTLACVFIGLQLFHVTKHPDVLPSISAMMLTVLTLGHMIPLVLNFEALFFGSRNRQNVLLWSGGWLEVNEVVVRLFTMVAFLLQFRLLQLTWSARLAEERTKGLWVAEKKALRLCSLLYIVGSLIALFVHWKMHEAPLWKVRFFVDSGHSIWGDLRSYAGLVLDSFLLPQILFNIFSNSKDKALAPSFYIGTTVVRLLPHAYDAYRTHKYIPYLNTSYIYANPRVDLYSTAWNVVIPCGGLLFCICIYLQQRFGGGCILPQRFRQPLDYEKVSVVSGQGVTLDNSVYEKEVHLCRYENM